MVTGCRRLIKNAAVGGELLIGTQIHVKSISCELIPDALLWLHGEKYHSAYRVSSFNCRPTSPAGQYKDGPGGKPSAQTSAPDHKPFPSKNSQAAFIRPDPAGSLDAFDDPGPHCQKRGDSKTFVAVAIPFSSEKKRKPGPKGPSDDLVRAIVETKRRNPR